MPGKGNKTLRIWQVGLFAGLLLGWYVLTSPTMLPPLYFDDPNKAAFFFGEPLKVMWRIWDWFSSGFIYPHLWVTLLETALAFVIGTVLGAVLGAILVATINNGFTLMKISEFWKIFFEGTAIVAAVTIDALITQRLQELLRRRRRAELLAHERGEALR